MNLALIGSADVRLRRSAADPHNAASLFTA